MDLMIEAGEALPGVEFKRRVGSEWDNTTSANIFSNKKVVVFGLPGAFTPTCSKSQLPGYEANFEAFQELGVDEVYCCSVNDTFVMNAWFENMGVTKVLPLADGSGHFTDLIGMMVNKDNLGFGRRSWRYAMVVDDGLVKAVFAEEGFGDNIETDPYEASKPEKVLEWLKGNE